MIRGIRIQQPTREASFRNDDDNWHQIYFNRWEVRSFAVTFGTPAYDHAILNSYCLDRDVASSGSRYGSRGK